MPIVLIKLKYIYFLYPIKNTNYLISYIIFLNNYISLLTTNIFLINIKEKII